METPNEQLKDSYKISLPLEFGVGASLRPVQGLLLAAGIHVAEWTQTEYRGKDESEVRANTSFESQYRDGTRYHFGVEWQVPVVALDLRAGYYTDPLPFVGPRDPDREVDSETNPLVIASRDRAFLTLGAGLELEEAVKVNLAWNHGTFERLEHPLKEEVTTDRVFIGLSYHF